MTQAIQVIEAQREAANPQHSVWVTANAGTGKTKVLTDRVLRLLLQGTPPEKILCLTYTRAAAAEMVARLQQVLGKWVALSDTELDEQLKSLTGQIPDAPLRRRARDLFLSVMEAPEGVRIMTLHSLCQSLLKRFSLEAKVSPYFRLMDEAQISILLTQAKHDLLTTPRLPKEIIDLQPSLRRIAEQLSEDRLDKLMEEIINHRQQLERWFAQSDLKVRQRVTETLGVNRSITQEQLYADFARDLLPRLPQLQEAARILSTSGKNDKTLSTRLADALSYWRHYPERLGTEAPPKEYYQAFFTQKHTPTKNLPTQNIADNHPAVFDFLQTEQQIAIRFYQRLWQRQAADWSLAVLSLAEALLALYDKQKHQRGLLDYDDLLHYTTTLLKHSGIAPWILYKLDNGLDHLLVDEAQDTSPVQWEIVSRLAEEFFSGESARKQDRTLFIVGDEKQSIYSFQGADPQKFLEMKQHFAQQIEQAGKGWKPVKLQESFRSTPAVLKLVDAVFHKDAAASDGVLETGDFAQHIATRSKEPGRVELWPVLLKDDDAEDKQREPWPVPSTRNARANESAEAQLANQIAQTIADWLKQGRYLPGRQRAILPSDIMILVRTRSPLFYRLIRALKRLDVPVAGEDRLKLHEQIAVQDVLALLDFLLLPEDDLSLACLLKSPFFGVDEDTLFTLAYNRKGSLWQQVQSQQPAIAERLSRWLGMVDYLRPYDLIAQILEAEGGREKLAAQLGAQVHDPLNELLVLAQAYEQLYPPSLQGFMQELRREEITIKREMEQQSPQVRVMTVHNSKGLQAPIVILPDTLGKPDEKDMLLWENDCLFFAPAEASQSEAIQQMKEARKASSMQEYRRQLYVALTRAADEVYIAGYLSGNRKNIPEDCWYQHILTAMQQIGQELDGGWVVKDCHPDPALVAGEGSSTLPKDSSLPLRMTTPDWLHCPAPTEPTPPRPLTPSRLAEAEPAQDSPLLSTTAKRGTLIHRLLEVLPDVPPEARAASAEILLKKQGIGAADRRSWAQEALAILQHENFAQVFAAGSMAEVPVTALLENGQVLSGQIDRLVVLANSVLIVDYKTSLKIPQSEAQLPPYFRAQMQAYVNAIAPIYPDKRIEAAILWTAAPKLMPLAITPSVT